MAKKNEGQELKDTTIAKKLGRTRKQTVVDGTPVPPQRPRRINGNPYATASAAPTPYKMTPAAQKAAGVTKSTTLRTTRLKTDVGLTAIPSPISLVPKKPKSIPTDRKMKAQAIQEDKIRVLTGNIDAPTSDTTKAKATTRGRKAKENEAKEEAKEEGDTSDTDESLIIKQGRGHKGKEPEVKKSAEEQARKKDSDEPAVTKSAKRVTRANSQAAVNKRNILEAFEDEEMEPFDLDPVFPLSPQQKTPYLKTSGELLMLETDSESDEATKLPQDEQATIQNFIAKVQNNAATANEKQLWAIEE
jgi:hypothetical protein